MKGCGAPGRLPWNASFIGPRSEPELRQIPECIEDCRTDPVGALGSRDAPNRCVGGEEWLERRTLTEPAVFSQSS